jgi:hypothetical protein
VSIPTKEVFNRVLTQVSSLTDVSIDLEQFRGNELYEPRWNAVLAIARGDRGAGSNIPSNLHFWAAGLRALEIACGRESSFESAAVCGLCTPIPRGDWHISVDALLGLAREAPAPQIGPETIGVYQMFDDGNRRSLLIESRDQYTAVYWENDTAPPASYPLLNALHNRAAEVFGRASDERWIAVQHHTDLSDATDVVYGWRVADGVAVPIARADLGDDIQLRFALSSESDQVEFAWGARGGNVRQASYWVRGEEAAIHLIDADEVEAEENAEEKAESDAEIEPT